MEPTDASQFPGRLGKARDGPWYSAADFLLLLAPMMADQARDLAYRPYTICERKGWAEEARLYNGLIVAWPELEKLASCAEATNDSPAQGGLFE